MDMCSNLHGSVPVPGLAVPTFLVRILPCHIVLRNSGRSVSGLAKKDGEFLSHGRFQGHRKFAQVGRTAQCLFTNDVLWPVRQFAVPGRRLTKLVVAGPLGKLNLSDE